MNRAVDYDECEMLLMDYARGVLNEAQRVLVASYLEMSEHARRRAAMFETLGAALMETCCEPVSMREDSLQAVMARLEGCGRDETCAAYEPRHRIDIPLPQPLCVEISVRCGPAASWRWAWPGVRVLRVPVPADAQGCTMVVVRMNPGARLPRHSHNVREITLVLDGAFADAAGMHRRGDILIMDAGTIHAPQADPRGGCSCLIVTESARAAFPLHWLARLMEMVR